MDGKSRRATRRQPARAVRGAGGMCVSTRQRRIRRTRTEAREEILDATEAALAEIEFADLTVDEVMRRTGMTRSSFYHYFASLDDLALAFLDRLEGAIRETVDPWLEGAGTADYLEDTRRHLTAMFEAMEAHRAGMLALVRAATGSGQVYAAWRTRMIEYFVALTARFIRHQVMLGRSRVRDPDNVARALILMNNALGNDRLLNTATMTAQEAGRTSAAIWNATIYGDVPAA